MISDEMLRNAAEEYEEALLSSLPEDGGSDHVFSPGFERKMRRLCHRAKYASVYSTMKRAACAAAALVLTAGMLLVCNTEARAAMLGWIREAYNSYFAYTFVGRVDEEAAPRFYDFAQVPEGYTLESRDDFDFGSMICYRHENGDMLVLDYDSGIDPGTLFIIPSDHDVYTEENIDGIMMEFYLSTDPKCNSVVLWTNDDNVMFMISAKCDKDTLIGLAKSVQEIK